MMTEELIVSGGSVLQKYEPASAFVAELILRTMITLGKMDVILTRDTVS